MSLVAVEEIYFTFFTHLTTFCLSLFEEGNHETQYAAAAIAS